MKNYSRQREAILTALHSTDTHPTASSVYDMVRKAIPNISLGTVYRNLSALSKDGDILTISLGDGYERFDGNILPHAHLHCKVCGKIIDLPLENDCISAEAKKLSFNPETSVYIVYGVCGECSIKEN